MMNRFLLIAFALLSCVSASLADGKRVKTEVPFRRPSMGVGGGEYSGVIFAAEDDKAVNTCAIVQSVSGLPAGLLQMPSDGLEAKQPYTTDYGKLTSTTLTEYNQQNPDMTLQAGPIYSVTYEVSYEVKKGFLLYQVKSKLYYAGRDSEQWYAYSKKYDDTFFSKKLLATIEQQVVTCAKQH